MKNYPSITRNNVCTIRIVVLANLLLQEKVWSKVSIATIHHHLAHFTDIRAKNYTPGSLHSRGTLLPVLDTPLPARKQANPSVSAQGLMRIEALKERGGGYSKRKNIKQKPQTAPLFCCRASLSSQGGSRRPRSPSTSSSAPPRRR